MRILLTGATGVIGRRVIPLLLAEGHVVTALAHDRPDALCKLGLNVIAGDLFDIGSLKRAAAGCDAIVNLATHMPSPTWKMLFRSAWRLNDRIRRDGSANVVRAAVDCDVDRVVQESFALTYPDRGDRWIDERTRLQQHRCGCGAHSRALHTQRRHRRGPAIRSLLRTRCDAIGRLRSDAPPGLGGVTGRARTIRFVGLARRCRGRGGGGVSAAGGRVQRRRRRAGHAQRLLRFARRMHRRETSAIHAQLGDFAVWIRRRNDGSFTSHFEPQTPRSLGLEAVASERSRRMADNARACRFGHRFNASEK